ncbi:MAG: cation:dicarboxylase symporter family transporter [Treponema sp.]|nr:cation:dicarboxylase symporter family transporter [Treponema sp.]
MVGKILKNPITILIAVILGILFGFYEKNIALSWGIIGDVYLNLFQMTVIPILVTSIVASLAMLMKDANARSHITKILLAFMLMLMATAVFGTLAGMLSRPGKDLGEQTTAVLDQIIKTSSDNSKDEISLYDPSSDTSTSKSSLGDFFANIVPSNIFKSFSNGSILQLVFFSIIFGVAIGFLSESSSLRLINGVVSLKESFQKLINWTMYGLPIGLVFLMGKQIAQVGVEILLAMVKFIVVFYAVGLAAMLVCTIIIWIRSGIKNPFTVLKKVMDPIIICFATRNSFASLPSSVTALKNLGLSENTVDLVFPLGVTILRFGNIMYFALAACFVAQIYDAALSLPAMLLIVVGSLLAGTATAGASGLLTLPMISLILDPLGLPVESILVVFMAIDSLIDPMRTLLIVYINIATTAIVASRETEEERNAKTKMRLAANRGDEILLEQASDSSASELPDFSADIQAVKVQSQAAYSAVKLPEISTTAVIDNSPDFEDTSSILLDNDVNRAQTIASAGTPAYQSKVAAITPPSRAARKENLTTGLPGGIKIKIRDALVLINTVLLILTATVIIRINSHGTQDSVYSVSTKLVTEILKSVDTKIQAYYTPADQAIHNISFHYWNEDRFHFKYNNEAALDYFMELLQTHKEFAMVYFGDTKGNLIMGRRMPDGTLTRRYITRTEDSVITKYIHENKAFNASFPTTEESLESGYDPRTRGWYKKAVAQKKAVWTNVYIFATDNMPGFSCAAPIYSNDGELEGVACIDIGIRDLSLYLGGISTTENSRLFIYDQDNQIIAKPLKAEDPLDVLLNVYPGADGSNSYSMKKVTDEADPIIAEAFKKSAGRVNTEGIYSFDLNGNNYFCKIDSMPLDQELSFNVGMIVPDNDIMGIVYKNNRTVLIISLIVIIVAIIISILMSSLISKPMKILSTEMNDIKELDIDDGEVNINSGIKEIDNMVDSFQGMKQGLVNFKKYVPSDLVTQLVKNSQSAEIGGKKQILTLLFSDIENFTGISEKTKPEELINRLYDYFSIFAHTITGNRGTIDKYIGDSIMAFWGAPVEMDVKQHATLACRAALTCQMQGFNLSNQWIREGKPKFRTRFGIHTGEVVVGNMGSDERINYTVLGDNVNLASRLEGINKYYGTEIIISANTHDLVKDDFEFRMLDKITVKGKTQPLFIYELLAEKGKLNQNLLKIYNAYERGLKFYFDGDWDNCIKYMSAVRHHVNDKAAQVILERAENFKVNPPEGWSGVYAFDRK